MQTDGIYTIPPTIPNNPTYKGCMTDFLQLKKACSESTGKRKMKDVARRFAVYMLLEVSGENAVLLTVGGRATLKLRLCPL